MIAAVVLAAGASSRMHAMQTSKALLRWRGHSFVGHVVDRAHAVGCAPIIVVEGAWSLASVAAELSAATVCHNSHWAQGPFSSLQTGVEALGRTSALIVATVDRPHVTLATWTTLVTAHESEPTAVWQPSYRHRRGHPVLLPASLCAQILAAPRQHSLRELLDAPDIVRRVVDVDDPGVLDNIDTPEDLEKLS